MVSIIMQDPVLIYETWDERPQKEYESSIVIDILVKSINFADGQADIQFSISKGLVTNETTYSHIYYGDSFSLYGGQTEKISISFKAHNNVSVYSFYSYFKFQHPFELYNFHFTISGSNDINLTSEKEIYARIWTLDTSKEFSPVDVDLITNFSSFSINVDFNMKRSPVSIFYEFLIPIIILLGIIYCGIIVTKPYLEPSKAAFKYKNNNLDESSEEFKEKFGNFKKEIDFDRKLRMDMSKWIFVFALANIFYGAIIPSERLSTITIGMIYAILSLLLSIAFYGTSKFQGKNIGTSINKGIAISSMVLLMSIVLHVLYIYSLADLINKILPLIISFCI